MASCYEESVKVTLNSVWWFLEAADQRRGRDGQTMMKKNAHDHYKLPDSCNSGYYTKY